MRFDSDEVINTGSNNLSKKNGNKSVISNINKYDPDDENNRSLYPEDEVNPNRIKLSFNAERTLSKIPSFSMRPQTDKRSFSDYKPLVLRSIPIFFWLVGLVFIVMAIILTINICIGDNKEKRIMDSFYGKHFWEYIILVITYIIGISFVIVARYETIEVDKVKGEMRISKFYILKCKKKYLNIPIENINAVFPTQVVTEHSQTTQTCLNKMGIQFNETSTVYVFKTIFKCFLIRDIIKLRMYLFKKISTYEGVEMELKGTETHMDIIK